MKRESLKPVLKGMCMIFDTNSCAFRPVQVGTPPSATSSSRATHHDNN